MKNKVLPGCHVDVTWPDCSIVDGERATRYVLFLAVDMHFDWLLEDDVFTTLVNKSLDMF